MSIVGVRQCRGDDADVGFDRHRSTIRPDRADETLLFSLRRTSGVARGRRRLLIHLDQRAKARIVAQLSLNGRGV